MNIQKQSKYQYSNDGLSTFINLANQYIKEQYHQGKLTDEDINTLYCNMQVSISNLCNAFELLGVSRIDYVQTNDNLALCGALLIASQSIMAFDNISDTLNLARKRNYEASIANIKSEVEK